MREKLSTTAMAYRPSEMIWGSDGRHLFLAGGGEERQVAISQFLQITAGYGTVCAEQTFAFNVCKKCS